MSALWAESVYRTKPQCGAGCVQCSMPPPPRPPGRSAPGGSAPHASRPPPLRTKARHGTEQLQSRFKAADQAGRMQAGDAHQQDQVPHRAATRTAHYPCVHRHGSALLRARGRCRAHLPLPRPTRAAPPTGTATPACRSRWGRRCRRCPMGWTSRWGGQCSHPPPACTHSCMRGRGEGQMLMRRSCAPFHMHGTVRYVRMWGGTIFFKHPASLDAYHPAFSSHLLRLPALAAVHPSWPTGPQPGRTHTPTHTPSVPPAVRSCLPP